jgi:hypothetical protein
VALQKLQLRPGVNRESTTFANEGGWYESDKVRFRSGFPEKLGGWKRDEGVDTSTLQPATGKYWGVARALWNWITTTGYNLLGIGSNLKVTIQNSTDGSYYDITPIRVTTAAGDVTFAATNGSTTLTVTDTAHGAYVGDFVTFSGAVSLGGNITATVLNTEFRVVSVVDANNYTITATATANASDTGNGGAAVVGAYQINTTAEIDVPTSGWGAGGWGGVTSGLPSTGWGQSAGLNFIGLWSFYNYGDYLLMNRRGGPIYMYVPAPAIIPIDRAVLLSSTSPGIYVTDAYCPSVCNIIMVSDSSRIVIAFGCNDLGQTELDPLLVRWSDQESYATWYPQITNQAGGYRLSHGSRIIGVIQSSQEILIWTESALYSMQYLGPPYTWGFNIMGDNLSIFGPNVIATANNVVYWMGQDKFYTYSGRVESLPCTLRQYIFGDINVVQAGQFFANTNEGFNEIWWFYCSANSNTIDRYVIYNYLERVWYYGTMARTAWLDSGLRHYPIAAGYDGTIIYHEDGVDDGAVSPAIAIEAYIKSADMSVSDGYNFGFVWRMIPDVTFDGSENVAPEVTLTMTPRRFPGAAYGTEHPDGVVSDNNYQFQRNYTVQQFTEQVYPRLRGRHIRFGISSNTVGTQWQLGVPHFDVRPDGRRG